jgi:hypothetical protein
MKALAAPVQFPDSPKVSWKSALRRKRALLAGVTFAAAIALPVDRLLAQMCSAPAVIGPNTSNVFDTCQGDHELVLACGIFPLDGPATVILLDLPYPVGEVSAQSLDINFQPTMFLLQAECNDSAPCNAVARSGPGSPATIDLSTIDSGRYFLVVAAYGNAGPLSCGPVNVTATLTADQEALETEGVFRAGNAPIADEGDGAGSAKAGSTHVSKPWANRTDERR